jgi:hypothetical protein
LAANGGKLRADCGKTKMEIVNRAKFASNPRAIPMRSADSITEFLVGSARRATKTFVLRHPERDRVGRPLYGLYAVDCYGILAGMDNQKITAYLPKTLLRRAQQATGKGITETLREGLELLSAREAGRHLREQRGKVKFSVDLLALRRDDR